MKLLIISGVIALAVAVPQFSQLSYTSDERSSTEEGVAPGPRSTNCSCGWTNKKRIVGGRQTLKNEYPLIAALVFKDDGSAFCGASILTTRHALTAAHCTTPTKDDAKQLVVGAHDLTNRNDPNKATVDVAYTIEHENYDEDTFHNDVALLVLAQDLTFSQFIGPVCLPTAKIPLENEWIKVLGWGRLKNKGQTSDVLMKVNLKVFPITTCAKSYIRPIDTKKPTQICTYRNNKDSCQGDSGGPLVWLDPETNRYTQVALVSYGKACASKAPAVNTDVAHFIPWIQAKIASTGLPGQTCSKV